MNLLRPNAALIVIDVQQAFDDASWGDRNNLSAEANIAELIAAWRATGRPIFHVHHRSVSPTSLFLSDAPGFSVKPEAQPMANEPVIYKKVNSAFIGTELEERLRDAAITTLVIVGLTTDHCVSTTARMAGNFGFETFIVSDATATFERRDANGVRYSAQLMHDTALASLNNEFANVVASSVILENLG